MTSCAACLLCRCSSSTLVQVGVRYAPDAEVRRCSGCGLVFLRQSQTTETLDEYYEGAYRAEYSDTSLSERYRSDLDEARTRTRRLLPWLCSDASLLELGCGSGAFLDAVRPYVNKVVGVEPDSASRSWVQEQLDVLVEERVSNVHKQGERFDLVVMFHVLEHTANPVEFLVSLKQLLKPAGRAVIEVPNINDMLVAVYRVPAYLPFYYQKAHLYYFSRDTLSATLRLAGLEGEIQGVQRYDLSNHLQWMLTGQPGGQGYYSDILNPGVCAAYAEALVRANRSDTLWAVVQPSQPET